MGRRKGRCTSANKGLDLKKGRCGSDAEWNNDCWMAQRGVGKRMEISGKDIHGRKGLTWGGKKKKKIRLGKDRATRFPNVGERKRKKDQQREK